MPQLTRLVFAWAALAAVVALAAPAAHAKNPYKGYVKVDLKAGPTLLDDLKNALLTAQPGTIIQLPKATLAVDEELSITVPYVVLRGKGKKTILDFSGQTSGGQGILVSADHVAFEKLTVLDTPGDGIRAESVTGITFRKVRVEWSGPLSGDNGAYGLYPVLAQDVLIEKCEVVGASDAGIYVGQSNNILVRKNKAWGNVAGIEIENSFDADVTKNQTWNNTAGILVFNLPGLTQFGSRTRVFKNKIWDNNAENVGSGTVGQVPPGSGILVLANDEVEIFKNKITGNVTTGISIAGYAVVGTGAPPFDAFCETIYIYNNKYKNNGTGPQGLLGFLVGSFFGNMGSDIFVDYTEDPNKQVGGELPPDLKTCIDEKKLGSFAALNLAEAAADPTMGVPSTDISPYLCSHTPLGEVMIPDPPPVP